MARTAADSTPPTTKAGFIRQFPTDTPADEIVALGAEAGLELNKKMIWTVQSQMRHPSSSAQKTSKKTAQKTSKKTATKKTSKKTSKKASTSKKKTPAKTSKKKAPTASKAAEQRLKALILQVGLARAEAVYEQLREQLDALLD